MKAYLYMRDDQVRDYECDLQGIVNNANYQHYLEHTRHKFLEKYDVSFARLHDEGTDALVARVSIDYKQSLRPGDYYRSCLNVCKEGFKYVFHQDIYRLPDLKMCIRARIDTVAVVNGRLAHCEEFDRLVQLSEEVKNNPS